jgi:hypothetical protein
MMMMMMMVGPVGRLQECGDVERDDKLFDTRGRKKKTVGEVIIQHNNIVRRTDCIPFHSSHTFRPSHKNIIP